MQDYYHQRSGRRNKTKSGKSFSRLALLVFLLAAIALLSIFGTTQFLTARAMQDSFDSMQEDIARLEEENSRLEERFRQLDREKERLREEKERLREENRQLQEENRMMRSETIIMHGSRDTSKVAITIDDGASAELTARTLDYLKEHDVKATLFPMGSWVEREPEVWRRAVKEGHELGNHTYSHRALSALSDDQVKEELLRWQEAVNEALGHTYPTVFFRPPYMAGFTSPGSSQALRLQEIIAGKGMFTVLWDIELVYALRNEAYTTGRVTEHVLENARGGSIVLLHFSEADINALPAILTGLRERGLEPCSLRELLLAEPGT